MNIKSFARYLWRFISATISWQPLTLRGIAVLVLAIFALQYLAFSEHDLAANVVGVATAAVIACFAAGALLLRLRLRRQITARCRFDEVHAYSSAAVPGGIVLDNCSVLPFFELEIERNFTHPGVYSPKHIVKGGDGPARRRYLIDSARFAHRGLWTLESLTMRISDIGGLIRLKWRTAVASSVEVAAPTIAIRPLPILVSSARAGDELSHTQERSGDPFDLKTYDPSDGVKRIMWKVYARSQQLVVRRPEPAVIPEGELALYLVAGRNEDYVAGALQGYLEQLEDEQIVVLFGTDGLIAKSSSNGSPSAGLSAGPAYCSGISEIRRAIVHSVWSDDVGTGRGFAGYLNSLTSSNRVMQRVVVFGPNRSDWLEQIALAAGSGPTQITAVIVPDEFSKIFTGGPKAIYRSGQIRKLIQTSYLDGGLRSALKNFSRGLRGSDAQRRDTVDTVAARSGIQLLRCERR